MYNLKSKFKIATDDDLRLLLHSADQLVQNLYLRLKKGSETISVTLSSKKKNGKKF